MNDWDVPYRQSVHEALAVLSGQWTVAVLAALALGERQFSDLLTEVNATEERVGWLSHPKPLTARVLTDTLRRLQGHRLIDRRADGTQFSAVHYQLSAEGRSLLGALRPLASWAQQHREPAPACARSAEA